MQIEYNRTPRQRTTKAIVDNFVCSFYRQLTINLRTDIAFKLSICLNISLTFTPIDKSSSILAVSYFLATDLSDGELSDKL